MTEHRETYLMGDENGDIVVVCERPECLRTYRGRQWWYDEPIGFYHPLPADIATAFDAHLATHTEPS